MRLVFIGSSRFGLRCLELALRLPGIRVVGAVTAPQTFAISYRPEGVTNVLHADVRSLCDAKGIPCVTLERSMREEALYDAVRGWQPDAFLVVGWYHMIPRNWRSLAPAYGLHASLLPDYSGGAPLVWAMINGETKTGISLFQMDDGVDSGPIVGQAEERILDGDTIKTLYSRIEERGLELLKVALPRLATGVADFKIQDESKRRVFPQRSPKDGRIDWTQDAVSIDRFIRAQTRPYPGAYTTLKGESITIWSASRSSESLSHPVGTVVQDRGKYRVCCGSGIVVLDSLQYRGQDIASPQLVHLLGPGGQRLGD